MTGSAAPISQSALHALLSAGEGATVVTPNRRLALVHKRSFDEAQRDAGHHTWVTPDILPIGAFFERAWRTLGIHDESSALPGMLDAAQNQLLWEQVIRRTDAGNALLNIGQAARQAAAAWSLVHAWKLLPALRNYPMHEDAEVFQGWARRYAQLCREKNVIDGAVLPDVLLASLGTTAAPQAVVAGTIVMAGFDIVTMQHHQFFEACAALGIAVKTLQPEAASRPAQVTRMEFADSQAELGACASWARHHAEQNPRVRLGIVVPDLRAKRAAISRALTDALAPARRSEMVPAGEAEAALFNISLGLPLIDYGLVRDALSLIEFSLNRNVSVLAVGSLLRSPFIAHAESELGSRARLDAALRESTGTEIRLFGLQRKLQMAGKSSLGGLVAACAGLCRVIDRVAALPAEPASVTTRKQRDPAQRPAPDDWRRHFTAILDAWGFPGEKPLDSVEYQVWSKFRDTLANLAALQMVQPRMRADEALGQLRRLAADTVFQPESPQGQEAPIQVLGILESAGQRFDALWVTGLSDDAWPLTARPNPFIPAVLQRRAGIPEASAEASLALDRHITEGWLRGATDVVLSHALVEGGEAGGEQARAASALIRHVALSGGIEAPVVARYAEQLQAIGRQEPIVEVGLMPLPVPTSLRGGATVLRDQSACAFRGFARHRLGATPLLAPAGGLDAAERGTLLHRVLNLVWSELKSHTGLISKEADAMHQLVKDAAGKAIREVHDKGAESLAGRFAVIERDRLVRVVVEWLDYERERAPFNVVACEQSRQATLAGLSMTLRLDRLDRLEDGTHAIIDYKTGQARVASWLGERPDEPQLPLYLHTAEQDISTIAYARVKRGERGKVFGFAGVSAVDGLLPDVTPIEQQRGMPDKGYVSWDVLVESWDTALTALANDFTHGVATVDPKHGGLTCAQCDLHGICRIAEWTGHAIAAEDSTGGPAANGADDE